MKTDNRDLVVTIIIGIILIVLVTIGMAYADDFAATYEGENVIVQLGYDEDDYSKEWISISEKGELGVCMTIKGRPKYSSELAKALEYFGLENVWSYTNNHLDYLKILVELGLEEGNL